MKTIKHIISKKQEESNFSAGKSNFSARESNFSEQSNQVESTTTNLPTLFYYEPLYHEEERKQSPTEKDYIQTIKLFKDFCIKPPRHFTDIFYSFKTYAQLEIWRRSYIVSKLKEIDERDNC